MKVVSERKPQGTAARHRLFLLEIGLKIGLAVALVLSVGAGCAATLRLFNVNQTGGYHGVEDTTIDSVQPEASFGGSSVLRIGPTEKILLRFADVPVPGGLVVQNASIELHLEKMEGDWKNGEILAYAISPASGGWNAGQRDGQPENGATCWNYLLYSEIKNVQSGLPMHTLMRGQKGFGAAGADYLPTPLGRADLGDSAAGQIISIPLPPETIQAWLSGRSNPGLLLVAQGTTGRAMFSSSESAKFERRPTLVMATKSVSGVGSAATGRIHYELKRPGNVSLSIYNAQGQVVRELLHAAERTAGAHDETWDGLDEAGQRVNPGSYHWKLLQTQGLHAEYLFTLGLSVDFFRLWPGNHVGVTGLAVDNSGIYFGSGCSEARGFVMKMAPDGTRLWTINENWFEAWQGPHSLAVDGNFLYMMQENYNVIRLSSDKGASGPIWNLVYDKTKPKDRPASMRDDGGWVKMKLGQAGETAAVDLAAGQGKLVMSYENFDCIRWIDPATGKILKETKVKEPLGVAIDIRGRALVISGGRILSFDDKSDLSNTFIAADRLVSPWRLGVNRANGDIWVVERGDSQQVKRFSAEGRLLQIFGAKGGRPAQGIYDGQIGFRNINSIAPAPDGSFWITEAFAAPRRLAHFSREGKLIREWYGPQMYANRASADPADPSIVWMDSMWGEVIQAKVDYARKTWKVLATYSYMNPLQGPYHHERGMWFVCHANGKTYLARETEPNVFLVDEPGRRLVPMFKLGDAFYPGGNAGWRLPADLRPSEDPWPGQTAPVPQPAAPWDFVWMNKTGGVQISRADMTFGRELFTLPHHGFVRGDLTYVTWLGVTWKEADNAWQRKGGPSILKPATFNKAGAPEYHWEEAGNLPLQMPEYLGSIRCLWEDDGGNIFTAHNVNKGRTGQGPFGVDRTASGLAANYVAKWRPDGTLLWAVGHHSATANTAPGDVRNFYRMAGTVEGCIAVNDIDYSMIHVWDQDGLWVGRLMDNGLVNAAIPKEAYDLCAENFGGYLFKNRADGQIYFFGGSYNATPVYKITGWDQFERQHGQVDVN